MKKSILPIAIVSFFLGMTFQHHREDDTCTLPHCTPDMTLFDMEVMDLDTSDVVEMKMYEGKILFTKKLNR